VLKRLMAREYCKELFNVPVDYVALSLPTYPIEILRPMDLGTIRDKLELDRKRDWDDKAYQYIEDFAADVRQVWKNALFFNDPVKLGKKVMKNKPIPVFDQASVLARDFEKVMAELHDQLNQEAPPCPKLLRAKLLLADIRRSPLSEWMRREEDWKALGEEYVNFLANQMRPPSKPCDLDAIKRWLEAHQQSADDGDEGSDGDAWLQEFEDKVKQVCNNAIAFNGPRTAVGVCAKAVKLGFELRIKQFKHAPAPRERGQRAPEREGFPAFEEKEEFYRDVNDLELLDQSRVGRLIAELCPAAVVPLDNLAVHASKRVRIDIDALEQKAFERAKALADERAEKAFENQMQDEYG